MHILYSLCAFSLKNLSLDFYICRPNPGAIAQLARAFDWQSRGRGFDSPWLHETNEPPLAFASGGFVFMAASQACLNEQM